MTEPSDGGNSSTGLPATSAPTPGNYKSTRAKERFAVAKFYGMGSDGEWTVPEIADELDVTERQVYRYLNESQIAEETREVLATTEAEWRLDLAIQLRREVQRLEEIEGQLLEKKEAIPVGYEQKTVEGTPTGDRNIKLPDHVNSYKLQVPVPTDFKTITDYGPDLERVQKEKRNYLQQIAKLLGLNAADRKEVDQTLATRHEEVKIVEYRDTSRTDDYPEQEVIDVDGGTGQEHLRDVDAYDAEDNEQ